LEINVAGESVTATDELVEGDVDWGETVVASAVEMDAITDTLELETIGDELAGGVVSDADVTATGAVFGAEVGEGLRVGFFVVLAVLVEALETEESGLRFLEAMEESDSPDLRFPFVFAGAGRCDWISSRW
jgi:hypothetical protein